MRRLLQFRTELMTLWRAFLAPETPIWLKALMLLIPAYLLNPFDFVPDFLSIVGWLDDAILLPLIVTWIVRMLPPRAPVRATRDRGGTIIDGDYRRL